MEATRLENEERTERAAGPLVFYYLCTTRYSVESGEVLPRAAGMAVEPGRGGRGEDRVGGNREGARPLVGGRYCGCSSLRRFPPAVAPPPRDRSPGGPRRSQPPVTAAATGKDRFNHAARGPHTATDDVSHSCPPSLSQSHYWQWHRSPSVRFSHLGSLSHTHSNRPPLPL